MEVFKFAGRLVKKLRDTLYSTLLFCGYRLRTKLVEQPACLCVDGFIGRVDKSIKNALIVLVGVG